MAVKLYDDGESFADKDPKIDWSRVPRLAQQIEAIEAIEDDDERLEAARKWQQRLGQGEKV